MTNPVKWRRPRLPRELSINAFCSSTSWPPASPIAATDSTWLGLQGRRSPGRKEVWGSQRGCCLIDGTHSVQNVSAAPPRRSISDAIVERANHKSKVSLGLARERVRSMTVEAFPEAPCARPPQELEAQVAARRARREGYASAGLERGRARTCRELIMESHISFREDSARWAQVVAVVAAVRRQDTDALHALLQAPTRDGEPPTQGGHA